MSYLRVYAYTCACFALFASFTLVGCVQTATTGENDGNTNGETTGDTNSDGAEAENPLPANCIAEGAGGPIAPSAEQLFPTADANVQPGEIAFRWQAGDLDGDDLEVRIVVSETPAVFDGAEFQSTVCASADSGFNFATVSLSNGEYFWGMEVSDGVNTVRRPANGEGVPFTVSESGSLRAGLDDAVLTCPGKGLPARTVTTFEWSLADVVPTRTQVYVSRANEPSPFDSPLRVFEVEPADASSFALAAADELPLGEELSWGLRIETAEQGVLFTFEGQLGESFVPAENIPPSGTLLSPADGAILSDSAASLPLAWEADAGNCEDTLSATVFFARPNAAGESPGLFESPLRQEVPGGSFEINLAAITSQLDIAPGLWAWGVIADDGTDTDALSDASAPARNFRTFFRDVSPEFTTLPEFTYAACGSGESTLTALAFAFDDGNGVDTVQVRVSFAEAVDGLFGPDATTTDVAPDAAGEGIVFMDDVSACAAMPYGFGFYGVELDDGVNAPVRAAIEFVGDPLGACCAADGGCTETTLAECDGGFRGANSTCAATECPVLIGACCSDLGDCNETVGDECDGDYLGEGTTCEDAECPALVGACCLSDGGCVETTAEACDGSFAGYGVSCSEADCAPAIKDCNTNGIDDAVEISTGSASDCDRNGVPDECQTGVIYYLDAGTLAGDAIDPDQVYSSTANNNDLDAEFCSNVFDVAFRWSVIASPSGTEIQIEDSSALRTSYFIQPAEPGTYVFQIEVFGPFGNQTITDTVSLTLTPAP